MVGAAAIRMAFLFVSPFATGMPPAFNTCHDLDTLGAALFRTGAILACHFPLSNHAASQSLVEGSGSAFQGAENTLELTVVLTVESLRSAQSGRSPNR